MRAGRALSRWGVRRDARVLVYRATRVSPFCEGIPDRGSDDSVHSD